MSEPSLEQMDQQARKASYDAMPAEIKLLDDLILHINHGTSVLTGQKHDRGMNFLWGLLINRAFNTLWRAREDAVCGYPVQSLALCRAALEDSVTLVWVERHPEAINRWLWSILEEVQQPKEWPPSFDKMWKDLKGSVTWSKDFQEAYDVLSKFGHPRGVGLRWLIHVDQDKMIFHFGPYFDHRDLRSCLFFLILVAQGFLDGVAQFQKRMLGAPLPEWVEKAKELSAQALVFTDKVAQEVTQPRSP